MRTRKTAVSISAKISTPAEGRGMSRSGLSAAAPVDSLRCNARADITRRLDAVYAEEAGTLAPGLEAAQAEVLPSERWW